MKEVSRVIYDLNNFMSKLDYIRVQQLFLTNQTLSSRKNQVAMPFGAYTQLEFATQLVCKTHKLTFLNKKFGKEIGGNNSLNMYNFLLIHHVVLSCGVCWAHNILLFQGQFINRFAFAINKIHNKTSFWPIEKDFIWTEVSTECARLF